MIDAKQLRDDPSYTTRLMNKGVPEALIATLKALDEQWRKAKAECDALINQRNTSKPKGKPTPEELLVLQALSETIKSKTEDVNELEARLKAHMLEIPNAPLVTVPIGKNEEENVEIKKEGTPVNFSFSPKSHEVLGESLQILNFDASATISGSRFVVYQGLGAKLERALIQLMLDIHTKNHGYLEIMPPALVRTESLVGTGQLPKFAEESFSVRDTDLWLSPTAEVQLTNLKRDTIIEEDALPLKLTAHTPCFRKEAGSYGKDLKGIIRLHQFNKVELVQFVTPETSEQHLQNLLGHAEAILKALELPYRVIELCTGDLGFSAAKTYDIEVWFPSQKTYREISSCSNFLDFQSRRAMIRYRSKDGRGVHYLHTLNGSGLAVGRTFAAILENYQEEDGSVRVPKVLQKYMEVERISCQTTIK